jgi:hypothetical protein
LFAKVCYELLQISMADIDTLAISRVWPVHMSYDIPREAHLFKPGNPLIDIRNNRLKEMTIGSDDFA